MYEYISGTVSDIGLNLAVIDVGGVGYGCKTTVNTLSHLQKGKQAKLYTYLHVREELMELYGFYSAQERGCFLQLLGVSGVGPKAALAVLSATSPEGFASAIITEDERVLTAAPGVGKKVAQRIILELKDKMKKESASVGEAYGGSVGNLLAKSAVSEAASALVVLGYSQSEINAALHDLDTENMQLQDIIKAALKRLAK